jgi:hypothetical protein
MRGYRHYSPESGPVDCARWLREGYATDHALYRGAVGGSYAWYYCTLGKGREQGMQGFGAEAAATPAAPKVAAPAASSPPISSTELATTMVLRGAVGTLIGAAAAPKGREGIWGAAGFVLGVTLGQMGIVAIATVALWKKVDRP